MRLARASGRFLAVFLDVDETLYASCVRELKEETNILVGKAALEASLKDKQVFDYPWRSTRGRTITTAFRFDLGDVEASHPVVRAADDAADARWIPINEIRSEDMFEDHYAIIQQMLDI